MLRLQSTWMGEALRGAQRCKLPIRRFLSFFVERSGHSLLTEANQLHRASLVTKAFTNCPNTKIVMSGYSQGAQLVHNAASELSTSTMEKVSAVVTFGDPGMSCLVLSQHWLLRERAKTCLFSVTYANKTLFHNLQIAARPLPISTRAKF